MKEIWKDIKNFDGYQISNFGNVKSLKKQIIRSNGRIQTFKEKILKTFIDGKGYVRIKISKNGNKLPCTLTNKEVTNFIKKDMDDAEIITEEEFRSMFV